MGNMKIPECFDLGGMRYEVAFVDDLLDETGIVGKIDATNQVIQIQMPTKNYAPSMEKLKQIYCHELVHGILDTMAEEELAGNERFVDLFATFLHQALDSAVGGMVVEDVK
jgi:hypothetical protein